MISMLFWMGCNLGGNTPPRFQTFNDREIKYLLGFAYLANPWEPITVSTGERWDFEIEVKDSNGDSIEIVFPRPPGELYIDQTSHSGYWEIPEDPLAGTLDWEPRGSTETAYTEFQVLAIDEQGASDILFVALEFERPTSEDSWDTSEDYWEEAVPELIGDMNIENRFEGIIQWVDPYGQCKITWNQVEGSAITPCSQCDYSWAFKLTQGDAETPQQTCLETQTSLESMEFQIGYNDSLIWNEMHFQNTMLFNHPEAGWVPYGDGEIHQQRLSFTLYAQ